MPRHIDLTLVVGAGLETVMDLATGRRFIDIMRERCTAEDPGAASDPDFFRDWLFEQRRMFVGTELWLHEARDAERDSPGEIYLGKAIGSAGSPAGALYETIDPTEVEKGFSAFRKDLQELGLGAAPGLYFVEYREG